MADKKQYLSRIKLIDGTTVEVKDQEARSVLGSISDEVVLLEKVTTGWVNTTNGFTVPMAKSGYTLISGVKAKVIVNSVVYIVNANATATVVFDNVNDVFALDEDDDIYVEFRAKKNT